MFDVREKAALITGGTRGIGLALARQLLAAGAHVAVNGRSTTPEAEGLLAEFGAERVLIALADVSDPTQAAALASQTAEKFGRLDILIHSAGGPVPGTVLALDPDNWMAAFALHVHAVFHLFRAAHPFLAREGGSVLLISSVAGLRGCPNSVGYQTVKGALIPLAKALAMDHAKEGIRVNLLAPGIIRTRFHNQMTDAAQAHNLANRIPLSREGTAEDVAQAGIAMIRNTFITGEILTVDGGMSMRITG